MSKGLERVEAYGPVEAESGRSAEELARERMLLDCFGIAGRPSIDRKERQAIRNAVEEAHSLDLGSPSRPAVTPEIRSEIRQAVRRYNDCR
ncbi:MAG: hypothetical protein KC777_08710 [Cyanobacteria bacterium HKST-UBA02]|nr:hypothetical protein [Cyanobacteria bacterium HKST-UBA02]